MPKPHRPHSPHPNAHTEQEIKWIKDYHRRNPNISLGELYDKLLEDKALFPSSRFSLPCARSSRLPKKVESIKKKSLHNKPYDTPAMIGIKWKMDVKFVPKVCYVGKDGKKLYQYTMIGEASRKRFIYGYADLQEQMKHYLRRSNSIPAAVLGRKSPNQKQMDPENICA